MKYLIICFTLFLVGCTQEPSHELVGTWQWIEEDVVVMSIIFTNEMDFKWDVNFLEENGDLPDGSFRFADDNKLEVTLDDGDSFTIDYELDEETLRLQMDGFRWETGWATFVKV